MKRSSVLKTLGMLGLAFLMTGCLTEGVNLTAPADPATANSPTFIELPSDPELAKALYDEEYITKVRGGDLTVSYGNYFSPIKVYMNVHFDAGSVSQDFKASLSSDTKYLSTDMALTFGPHGTDFLKPALLTLKVSGLNLSAFKSLDSNGDGIVYLNMYYTSNGAWEKMGGKVMVNTRYGTLEGSNLELPHFSRYAFGI